jgi:hypothetical protein
MHTHLGPGVQPTETLCEKIFTQIGLHELKIGLGDMTQGNMTASEIFFFPLTMAPSRFWRKNIYINIK